MKVFFYTCILSAQEEKPKYPVHTEISCKTSARQLPRNSMTSEGLSEYNCRAIEVVRSLQIETA